MNRTIRVISEFKSLTESEKKQVLQEILKDKDYQVQAISTVADSLESLAKQQVCNNN